MIEQFQNNFEMEDNFEIHKRIIEDLRLFSMNNAMPVKYKIIFDFSQFN